MMGGKCFWLLSNRKIVEVLSIFIKKGSLLRGEGKIDEIGAIKNGGREKFLREEGQHDSTSRPKRTETRLITLASTRKERCTEGRRPSDTQNKKREEEWRILDCDAGENAWGDRS